MMEGGRGRGGGIDSSLDHEPKHALTVIVKVH